MLTDNQIQHWRDHGYVMAPSFFSQEEVRAIQMEVERLRDEGRFNNVSTLGDGKTEDQQNLNLQLHQPGNHSPLIRALPFSDKFFNSVSALVGTPNEIQTTQIFYKPGGNGSATNWHQDNAYFGAMDVTMGTGIWIAVHDANEENGTMRVIPGSHLEKYDHDRDLKSNHHIRCHPDENKAISCVMPAGGVLFFNYGVAHCTGPNQTQGDRAGLALHVHHVDMPLGPGQIHQRLEKNKTSRRLLSGGDGGKEDDGESQYGLFDKHVRQVLE